jgi:hypothetical protein
MISSSDAPVRRDVKPAAAEEAVAGAIRDRFILVLEIVTTPFNTLNHQVGMN